MKISAPLVKALNNQISTEANAANAYLSAASWCEITGYDGAASWTYDYILWDDGPDRDLGYPSSIELDDGSILTMYYQKPASKTDKCALLWSRWSLPE